MIKKYPSDRSSLLNSACARALANNRALQLDTQPPCRALVLGLNLPELPAARASIKQTLARAGSDAIAMVDACHNEALHRQNRPAAGLAAQLFDEMERTRCECLGAAQFAGVEKNLASLWHLTLPLNAQSISPIAQLQLAIICLTRHHLRVDWQPPDWITDFIRPYQPPQRNRGGWQQLWQQRHRQTQFAALSLQIIDSLPAQLVGAIDPAQLAIEPPTPAEQPSDPASEQQPDDNTEATEDDSDETIGSIKINIDLREAPEPVPDDSDDDDLDATDIGTTNRDAPSQLGDNAATGNTEKSGYTIYSSAFDEIVHADKLCSAAELDELRQLLDQQIERHARVVSALSGKLQRLLMAQQQRHWIFDLEEGQLDTAQLTRIVTQPASALSFKQESEIKFKDTTVTLLVDNSKSMLGKPIAIAAACADLLAQTLERCGISVEILGFTTTQLHGGTNVALWQQAGGPINPGRLNGLRHIIYKSAAIPYRRARKGIGLMLRPELLNQNIDGEALLWANQRLTRRTEQRKILMVISDGAPLDTSTMAANRNNILIEHLHQVIADIERRATTELVAIGIGHDVGKFYKRATNIYDSRYLGRAMLTQLTKLFSAPESTAALR